MCSLCNGIGEEPRTGWHVPHFLHVILEHSGKCGNEGNTIIFLWWRDTKSLKSYFSSTSAEDRESY